MNANVGYVGDMSPNILKRAGWFVHDQSQALVLRADGASRHNEKVEYCCVFLVGGLSPEQRTAAIHVRKNVRLTQFLHKIG